MVRPVLDRYSIKDRAEYAITYIKCDEDYQLFVHQIINSAQTLIDVFESMRKRCVAVNIIGGGHVGWTS